MPAEPRFPLARWLRKRIEEVYDELPRNVLDNHAALPPVPPPRPGRRGRSPALRYLSRRLCIFLGADGQVGWSGLFRQLAGRIKVDFAASLEYRLGWSGLFLG